MTSAKFQLTLIAVLSLSWFGSNAEGQQCSANAPQQYDGNFSGRCNIEPAKNIAEVKKGLKEYCEGEAGECSPNAQGLKCRWKDTFQPGKDKTGLNCSFTTLNKGQVYKFKNRATLECLKDCCVYECKSYNLCQSCASPPALPSAIPTSLAR